MGLARAVLLYTYSLLQGEDMEGALVGHRWRTFPDYQRLWLPTPSADSQKSPARPSPRSAPSP